MSTLAWLGLVPTRRRWEVYVTNRKTPHCSPGRIRLESLISARREKFSSSKLRQFEWIKKESGGLA